MFGCSPATQDHERCEKNRRALDLQRSFELTMLAALGAEVLVLARCPTEAGGSERR
jgi:hypothetical protein